MPLLLSSILGPGQNLSVRDLGEVTYEASLTGNGVQTVFTVPHDLGTTNVDLRVRSALVGATFDDDDAFVIETDYGWITDGTAQLVITFDAPIPDGEVWKAHVLALGRLRALNDGNSGSGATIRTQAAATITTGTLTIDATAASDYVVSMDADVSEVVVTWPDARITEVRLTLVFDAALRIVVWPSGWWWPETAPTAPASAAERVVVTLYNGDGGSTVYARAERVTQP